MQDIEDFLYHHRKSKGKGHPNPLSTNKDELDYNEKTSQPNFLKEKHLWSAIDQKRLADLKEKPNAISRFVTSMSIGTSQEHNGGTGDYIFQDLHYITHIELHFWGLPYCFKF